MSRIDPATVRPPERYEPVRDQARRELDALRAPHRIALDNGRILLFENHRTLRGVIEEQLRADGVGESAVGAEVERANRLLGEGPVLVALLLLDEPDQAAQHARLGELRQLAPGLRLVAGEARVPATVEAAGEDDPVPVLRFEATEQLRQALASDAEVRIEGPGVATTLGPAQRAAIAAGPEV